MNKDLMFDHSDLFETLFIILFGLFMESLHQSAAAQLETRIYCTCLIFTCFVWFYSVFFNVA